MNLIDEKALTEMFPESMHDIVQRRIRGVPWYSKGRGNRARRRAFRIAEKMTETHVYTKDFNRLIHV